MPQTLHNWLRVTGQILVIFFLWVLAGGAQAQAPAWQTAVALGQTSGQISHRNQTFAANGDVYLTGIFSGTVSFGSTQLVGQVPVGPSDVFIAKWSRSTGSFSWALSCGGRGSDEIYAVAVSGTDVYIGGSFSGAVGQFGSTRLNNPNPSTSEGFVAKVTDTGTSASFAWAERFGDSESELVWALAVSGTNVYVTGEFRSPTMTVGSTTLTNANQQPSAGIGDVFIAKLTDMGASASIGWAKQAGSFGADAPLAVVARGSSVYVAGVFRSFGATFGTINLVGRGNFDVFVTKLTDNGATASFVWALEAGGSGDEYVSAMDVTATGIYLLGNFAGYYNSTTASFGSTTLTSSSVGESDVFVAKLTDAGTSARFVWARGAGGPGIERTRELAVRGSALYITGDFRGATATFGPTVLTNAGPAGQTGDGFLAKLTDAGTAGSFAWVVQAGGAGGDDCTGIFINTTTISVSGVATPPAAFGNLPLAGPSGVSVPFLATIADPALTAAAAPAALAGLALFPNPARTATTVRLPAVPGTVAATLTLLDALGRAVRTLQVPLPAAGATAEVPLAGLAPGLYRLRVQAGGQQGSRALAVE